MIKARLRVGASWSDACILNLSSRGMLVQSPDPPGRGNFLEIRRGRHIVVARVIWSSDQRFGVQTQDIVHPDDLIREVDNSHAGVGAVAVDRRRARRPAAERHQSSRQSGRWLEFGSLAIFGIASAFLLFATLAELLGRPMARIEAALASTIEG